MDQLLFGPVVNSPVSEDAPHSFTRLLRLRAFAVLFAAEIQSLVGDQIARVALAVLVFDRTDSVADTALTYALTYLPGILGGLVLARIGDRLPRAPVLVGTDIVRIAVFALMGLPNVPILVLLALLSVAVFVEPAFSAAQFAYLAAELDSVQMRSATGLRMAAAQAAGVAGFALGGLLVAVLGARRALIIDALTFAVSALTITLGLRVVRGARAGFGRVHHDHADVTTGTLRWIRSDPRIRRRIGLICLAGFVVVPEGLAVPYANEMHESTFVAGLLLASMPLGAAVGAVVLARFVPTRRRGRAALAMAMSCGLPLLVSAANPPWQVVLVAWAASGVLAAYQVEVIAQLADVVPDARRASVMGIAGGSLIAAQGLGIGMFGIVGQWLNPGPAIALAGLLAVVVAVALVAVPNRSVDHLVAAGHSS